MSFDGKRMLVTGATGFIGGGVVRKALQRGFVVRVLIRDPRRLAPLVDSLSNGQRRPALEPFEGDLRDPASLTGVERDIDVVVHCAGMLGKWGMDDRLMRDVNVKGSLHLLERFGNMTSGRFIHLSAGGVTGPLRERAVDETYNCQPATDYERTKLQGERAVLERARELDVPAIVVRPTFTYGPGDPHKLALFRAVRKRRFAFIGDGESVFHPVYIDDLLDGIVLAIERAEPGEVYILGGERPVSKNEFVFTVADALEAPRPRIRLPYWLAWSVASLFEGVGRALGFEPILTRSRVMMMGDNFGYSIAKASRDLGYRPSTDLATGIRRTVEAYREQGLL